MSSFFRRLRREKAPAPKSRRKPAPRDDDDEAIEAETGDESPPVVDAEPLEELAPAEAEMEVAVVAPPPVAASMGPAGPEIALPSGSPPPLPEADAEQVPYAPRSRTTARHCFICGTEQDGPWCPTCRMVWTE